MQKFVRLYLTREKSKNLKHSFRNHSSRKCCHFANAKHQKHTFVATNFHNWNFNFSWMPSIPFAKWMLSHVKAISEISLEWVTRYAMKTSCFSPHTSKALIRSELCACSMFVVKPTICSFLACDSHSFNLVKKLAKSVYGARTCTQHDANENTEEKNSICLLTILEPHNRRKWNRKFQH